MPERIIFGRTSNSFFRPERTWGVYHPPNIEQDTLSASVLSNIRIELSVASPALLRRKGALEPGSGREIRDLMGSNYSFFENSSSRGEIGCAAFEF